MSRKLRAGVGFDGNGLTSGSYADPEMLDIFSAENSVTKWLEFEAALARSESRVGVIPDEAGAEITRAAHELRIDISEMRDEVEFALHPVVPMVRRLAAACESDFGGLVHWGATTQDVMDSGLSLQIREASSLIDSEVVRLMRAAIELAEQHANSAMPGRTHAQHAVPITFGYKVAVWLDELTRTHQAALQDAEQILAIQFGGATGTLAALGSKGLEVREVLAAELGLSVPVVTWHASRDRLLRFGFHCLLLAITCQKIGREVTELQRTEILELEEPFHYGKVGSSTMPHKRNPAMAETLMALGSIAQGEFAGLVTASVQGHERDMAAWQQEWDRLPRLTVFAHRAVQLAAEVLEGLQVNVERMKQNVGISRGLILSESTMMGLAARIGRQEAHELVYDAAMTAHQTGADFFETLRASDLLPSDVDIAGLAERPETLEAAPIFVKDVVDAARAHLDTIREAGLVADDE